MVGPGLTVIVNVTGRPSQVPLLLVGVTVMVAVSGDPVEVALKPILPLPEAGRPMAGLSLVQEKVAPALPLRLMFTACPSQVVTSAG